MLAKHVELLEDNIAKKFRGQDSVVEETAPVVIPDDRIFTALDFSIGASTVADARIYVVPAVNPAIANGVFVLSRAIVWLKTRLGTTDTGNVNVRVGTSLGDNSIVTDQNVVAATTTGVIGGLSLASRGTAMLVANGYEAQLAPSSEVWVRAATTGTITQGTVVVELFGYFYPTSTNG